MPRGERSDLALQFEDGVIGVRAGEHVEHALDLGERLPAQFQCLDGVGKCRLRGSCRDGGNLGGVGRKSVIEGGAKIRWRNRAEWRDAERCGPILQQRVVAAVA